MRVETLRAGRALAEIVPERGALCTRLVLGGEELLFLDPATLADPAKNVRGGIPVLFPSAGRLPGDAYEVGGERFGLKQHGFARNLAWEPQRNGDARLECRLRSTATTLAEFPFPFEALLAFELEESALRLVFSVHNTGDHSLPFHLGFHPYFCVADKAAAEVETLATRAFDNRTGKLGALGPLDFTAGEVDLHLLDHRESGTCLTRTPGAPIRLRWSPEFRVLVLWTLPDRAFVCVEPWTAPAGALATGAGVLKVAPGDVRTLAFEIAL